MMSDTIQVVRWSLGVAPVREGYLRPPIGRQSENGLIWQSIHRTGIEAELRRHFRVAERIWHCLWIDSPLTSDQCLLLHRLFTDVAILARRSREDMQPFLAAVHDATETGAAFNVKLAPPGHVDMGWITTFVHCPRCKAEGSFPRWRPSYPVDAVVCEVCGNSYSPAATFAMEREYFAAAVVCSGCGAAHRVKDFRADEIETLENHHRFREFGEELVWLRRVAAFYQRHPERQRRAKPRSASPTSHEEPPARAEPATSGPTDSRGGSETPAAAASPAGWSQEDDEVLVYLRHNLFSLEARWNFVADTVERLRPLVEHTSVVCPHCGDKLS